MHSKTRCSRCNPIVTSNCCCSDITNSVKWYDIQVTGSAKVCIIMSRQVWQAVFLDLSDKDTVVVCLFVWLLVCSFIYSFIHLFVCHLFVILLLDLINKCTMFPVDICHSWLFWLLMMIHTNVHEHTICCA